MINNSKYNDLVNYIKSLEKVVIAFSGGIDSTFLLTVCKNVLKDNVLAVTIVSPYIPNREVKDVKNIISKLKVKHEFIQIPLLENIKSNPEERCYICKKFLFENIINIAKSKGFNHVIEGTNADDLKDYRPGIRALRELNIESPLLNNNITKNEIRSFSKELGIEIWNKPSYACLLSRIPYGENIDKNKLEKIEKAEDYLISLGFTEMRVRCHNDLARIEVKKEYISKFLEESLRLKISEKFKNLGFKYVALDLEGYRTGSLNRMENQK